MSKILNSKSMIAILIVVGVVVFMFSLLRTCGRNRVVNASVSHSEITLGRQVAFADSTKGASSWLWEFGDGHYSHERSGAYEFPEAGRYQIRLKVDGELEKLFLVRVRPSRESERFGHLISINAPATAVQGEYVRFTAEGEDTGWKWEFAETGIIDSREKTAIYAYQNHGIYHVSLSSLNSKYPVYHTIEILPKYMEVDSLDVMTVAALDIKEKLQNIADGKPFNPNYNHILRTYLCGNPHVLVSVNSNKRNDFYSYCQGLRIAGRNNTLVDMVFVESNDQGSSCIDHIIVSQYDRSARLPL